MRGMAAKGAIGCVLLLGLSLLLAACIGPVVPAGTKSTPSNSPFDQAARQPSPVASPTASPPVASPVPASPAAATPLTDAEATALVGSRIATAIAVQDEHLAATAQAQTAQAVQATQTALAQQQATQESRTLPPTATSQPGSTPTPVAIRNPSNVSGSW